MYTPVHILCVHKYSVRIFPQIFFSRFGSYEERPVYVWRCAAAWNAPATAAAAEYYLRKPPTDSARLILHTHTHTYLGNYIYIYIYIYASHRPDPTQRESPSKDPSSRTDGRASLHTRHALKIIFCIYSGNNFNFVSFRGVGEGELSVFVKK